MYESKMMSKGADRLFDAIMTLKTREDCYRFFEDIMTVGELNSMVQRFEVACMLDDGVTYQEIVSATKVSSATISRVNRCLLYGSGGYKQAIERLKEAQS